MSGFEVDQPKLDDVDAKLMKASVAAKLFQTSSAPAQIAHYVVGRRLGQGAMGVVYQAHDPTLDRQVAIKLLRHARGDARRESRLLREAQALAKISHPNVVQIYEVGRHEGQIYIAMEFIHGVTLRAAAKGDWRASAELFDKAGRGLAAAHRAGLIHRDFKPDNVLIGEDGRVCVLDFGLARPELVDAGPTSASTDRSPAAPLDSLTLDASPTLGSASGSLVSDRALHAPMTRTGACLGTPAYMAPEQYAGTTVDARCDQFSFCVAFWERLTGERPFTGKTAGALQMAILEGPPTAALVGVPPKLRALLTRGLRVDPADRFPDMDALLAELASCLSPSHKRPRSAMLAPTSLVAAGAIAAAFLFTDRVELCQGAETELATIWAPDIEAELARQFAATDGPGARDMWESTRAALSSYARDWIDVHDTSCKAALVERELSAPAYGRRLLCLGERQAEFAAAIELLEQPDASILSKSVAMAGRLTPSQRCLDDATLAAVGPAQPTQAPIIGEIDRFLAQGWGQNELGRYDEALASADTAAKMAQSQGSDIHLARAELLRAEALLRQREDIKAAATHLNRAIELSEHTGDRLTEVRARTLAIQVLGVSLHQFARADEMASKARALLDSLSHNELLLARLEAQLGSLATTRSDFEGALEHHGRAYELRKRVLGPDHTEVGVVSNNMGNTLMRLSRLAQAQSALDEAARIFKAKLGPHHPWVAITLRNSANNAVELAKDNNDSQQRARLLETAIARYREVLELHESRADPDNLNVVYTRMALANALHLSGDARAGLELQRRAMTGSQAILGEDAPILTVHRTAIGHCLFDLGRDREAVQVLETAIDGFARHGEALDLGDRAEAKFVLAQALARQGMAGPERVAALLEAARQDYSTAKADYSRELAALNRFSQARVSKG